MSLSNPRLIKLGCTASAPLEAKQLRASGENVVFPLRSLRSLREIEHLTQRPQRKAKYGRALIFQKGPFLIVVVAPAATGTDKLVSLGDGFQV